MPGFFSDCMPEKLGAHDPAKRCSIPKRVLHFHQQLVRCKRELPSQRHRIAGAKVVIVNHEKIAEGIESPPQATIGPERARLRVVLLKAGELQVGRKVQTYPGADEILGEIAFRHLADVVLASELSDQEGRWLPCCRQLVLVEASIVEFPEPPGGLRAESSFCRQPTLEAESVEMGRADGHRHSVGNLER